MCLQLYSPACSWYGCQVAASYCLSYCLQCGMTAVNTHMCQPEHDAVYALHGNHLHCHSTGQIAMTTDICPALHLSSVKACFSTVDRPQAACAAAGLTTEPHSAGMTCMSHRLCCNMHKSFEQEADATWGHKNIMQPVLPHCQSTYGRPLTCTSDRAAYAEQHGPHTQNNTPLLLPVATSDWLLPGA